MNCDAPRPGSARAEGHGVQSATRAPAGRSSPSDVQFYQPCLKIARLITLVRRRSLSISSSHVDDMYVSTSRMSSFFQLNEVRSYTHFWHESCFQVQRAFACFCRPGLLSVALIGPSYWAYCPVSATYACTMLYIFRFTLYLHTP